MACDLRIYPWGGEDLNLRQLVVASEGKALGLRNASTLDLHVAGAEGE